MGKRFDVENRCPEVRKEDIASTPHGPVVTADEFSATLGSLIKGLEDATNDVGKMAKSSSALRHLIQSRCNPPSILWWTLIAAEKSASLDMTKTDSLEIAKDILNFAWSIFESVKCLTSTTSSGRTALASMAPVVGLLFDVASLVNNSLSSLLEKKVAPIVNPKQLSKSLRKLKEFLRVFLGYICVCRCRDLEEFRRSPALSLPPAPDSILEKYPGYLYPDFPLASKSMRKLLRKKPFDIAVLAEVVVVQGILLQLAVELLCHRFKSKSQGTNLSADPPFEFIEDLKNLAINSVSAASASVPELLLDTLREKTLPVLDLLDEKEEAVVRRVLFETVVVDRPLFSAYAEDDVDSTSYTSGLDHDCVLYMKKLFTARKAIIFFRSRNTQNKSVGFLKQMTSWDVPPALLKWLKSLGNQHVPVDALQDNQALTSWLVNTADKSTFKELFLLALRSAVRHYGPVVEEADIDESKPESDNAETLFFVDTTGDGETGTVGSNPQPEALADAEFTAAAKGIKGVSGTKKRKKSNILFDRQGSPSTHDARRPRVKLNAQSEDIEMNAASSDGNDDLTATTAPEVEARLSPSLNSGLDGKDKGKRRKRGGVTDIRERAAVLSEVSSEIAGTGLSMKQVDPTKVEMEPQEYVASLDVRRTADGEASHGLPDLIPSREEKIEEGNALLNSQKPRKPAKQIKGAMDSKIHEPVVVTPEVAGEGLTVNQVGLREVEGKSQESIAGLDIRTAADGGASNELSDLIPSREDATVSEGAPEEENTLLTGRKLKKSAKKKNPAMDSGHLATFTPEVLGEGMSKQADVTGISLELQEYSGGLDKKTTLDGEATNECSDLMPSQKDASVSSGSPGEEKMFLTGKKLSKSAKKKTRASDSEIQDLAVATPKNAGVDVSIRQVDATRVDLALQGYTVGLDTKTAVDGQATNELSDLTPSRKDTSVAEVSPEEGEPLLTGKKSTKSAKKKKRAFGNEIQDLAAVAQEIVEVGVPMKQVDSARLDVEPQGSNADLGTRGATDNDVSVVFSGVIPSQKDILVPEGFPQENLLLTGKKLAKSAKKKKRAQESEMNELAAVAREVAGTGAHMKRLDPAEVDVEPQGSPAGLDTRIAVNGDANGLPSLVTPSQMDIPVSEGSPEKEKTIPTDKKSGTSAKKKMRAKDSEIHELAVVAPELARGGVSVKQVDPIEVGAEPRECNAVLEFRTVGNDDVRSGFSDLTLPGKDTSILEGSPDEENALRTSRKSTKSAKKKKRAKDSEIHDSAAAPEEAVREASIKQVDEREIDGEPQKSVAGLDLMAGVDNNVNNEPPDSTPSRKDVSVSENSGERRALLTSGKSSKSSKKKKPPMDGEVQELAAVATEFSGDGLSMMRLDGREVDADHHGPAAVLEGVLTADAELVTEGRIDNTRADEDMGRAQEGVSQDLETSRSSLCWNQSEDREKRADDHGENVRGAQISGTVDSDTTRKEAQQPGPVSTSGRKKRPKGVAHNHGQDDELRIRELIMNEVVDMSASVSGADLIDALQTRIDGQNDVENFRAPRKKIKLRDTDSNEIKQVGAVSEKVMMASPAVGNKTDLVVYSQSGNGINREGTSVSKPLMKGSDDLRQVPSIVQGSVETLTEDVQGRHEKVATGLSALDRDRSSHATVGGASTLVEVTVGTTGDSKKEQVFPIVVTSGESRQHGEEDDKGDGRPKVEVLGLLSATPDRPSTRKGRVKGDSILLSDCETPSGRLSPRRTRSGRELGTPQTPVSKRKSRKKLDMQPLLEEEQTA